MVRLAWVIAMLGLSCSANPAQRERSRALDLRAPAAKDPCAGAVVVPGPQERTSLEVVARRGPPEPIGLEFTAPADAALFDQQTLGLQQISFGEDRRKGEGAGTIRVAMDAFRARPWFPNRALTLGDLVPADVELEPGWHYLFAWPVSEGSELLPAARSSSERPFAVRRIWFGPGPATRAPPEPELVYNLPSGTYELPPNESDRPARETLLDFWSAPGRSGSSAPVLLAPVLVEWATLDSREVALVPGGGTFRLPLVSDGDYRVTLTRLGPLGAPGCRPTLASGELRMRPGESVSQVITVQRVHVEPKPPQ